MTVPPINLADLAQPERDLITNLIEAAREYEPWGYGSDAPPEAIAAFNRLREALAKFESG